MKRGFILKSVAVLMAWLLVLDIIVPNLAFGLSGGPSQPELGSFTPIGSNNMVDPFTGDFNYNMPLMTVPGPNGGYPINMAYNSGITIEQEASWVGLGWNLNPGSISREMRGLPDDFKGDNVVKEVSFKPDVSASVGFQWEKDELFGFETNLDVNNNLQINYSNSTGFGIAKTVNYAMTGLARRKSGPFAGALGALFTGSSFGLDSRNGLEANPSISLFAYQKKGATLFHTSLGYSGKEGLNNVSLSASRKAYGRTMYANLQAKGAGVSFSGASFVPRSEYSMFGVHGQFAFKPGKKNKNFRATGKTYQVSANWLSKKIIDYKAFGYMYSEAADGDEALMDVNREKDVALSKDSKTMPIPFHTYDIYYVKNHGVNGSFRPHRSDVGVLSDPVVKSRTVGGAMALEVDSASVNHFGSDLKLSYATSYSGEWKSGNSAIQDLEFTDSADNEFYEPYYMQSSGDMTADFLPADLLHSDDPLHYEMKRNTLLAPKVTDQVMTNSNVSQTLSSYNRAERSPRALQMNMRSVADLKNDPTYLLRGKYLYDFGEYPTDGNVGEEYEYGEIKDHNGVKQPQDHHVGKIEVLGTDGTRYNYGIPVYNTYQEDVVFSVEAPTGNPDPKVVDFTDGISNTTDNSDGDDHYFSSTQMPPYAHSYLLTSVVSADYVDLSHNGPSEDDFGYWVKFNHTKLSNTNYQWRVPYEGANYMRGDHSNDGDDKASYAYGEKEIYYLNSIETKTHIAKFIVSSRMDARGVDDDYVPLHSNIGDQASIADHNTMKKLDRIELYSKDDMQTPVATVHFEYDYSLCAGVLNNPGGTNVYNPVNQGGKLTLKKVWITYRGNDKGSLSPYTFCYYDTEVIANQNPDQNPDYGLRLSDRWGNYQEEIYTINNENPYVNQFADFDNNAATTTEDDEAKRHNYASAWSLRRIGLPSGGKLAVEYESDDYAYIHDKPVMQMMEIVATGSNSTDYTNRELAFQDATNGTPTRIYFKIPEDVTGWTTQEKEDYVDRAVAGINDDLYFKVYVDLKNKFGSILRARDYVVGFTEVDHTKSTGVKTIQGIECGYFDVRLVRTNNGENSSALVHPFRKAAWQYLKLKRSDLFERLDDVGDFPFAVAEKVGDMQFFTGWYKHCLEKEYAAILDDSYPSYVRLNNASGQKYGGGCRVKKVVIEDQWNTMTGSNFNRDFSYGQEYFYQMEDGTSSGVAAYEPLVGGDENATRVPERYEADRFLAAGDELYTETPFGEMFYPGASVGYRRVVSRNIERDEEFVPATTDLKTELSAGGFHVSEFYTTKEFPIKIRKTKVQSKRFRLPGIIPFIGTLSINNGGFSQGYSVMLNDMHGKPKRQAVYPYEADLDNFEDAAPGYEPTSESKYIYKTRAPYSDNSANYLDNTVEVLTDDAVVTTATLGRKIEAYVDMRENQSFSIEAGAQANVDVQVFGVVPSVLPLLNTSNSVFRLVVMNKVIHQNGILEKVIAKADGAYTETENLLYDAQTGNALLSRVNNNFDEPIYSYNYAAHWAYDAMGPAYQNQDVGVSFTFTDGSGFDWLGAISGGVLVSQTDDNQNVIHTDLPQYYKEGDEVTVNTYTSGFQRYWVKTVDEVNNQVILMDEQGLTPADDSILSVHITRSGYRNQQAIGNGTIVSLTNPVSDRKFPLYDQFNVAPDQSSYSFSDCYTGDSYDVVRTINGEVMSLEATSGAYNCTYNIHFPTNGLGHPHNDTAYTLSKVDDERILIVTEGGITLWGTPENDNCFSECLDGVLHADATEYQNLWSNYNYLDVGDPLLTTMTGLTATLSSNPSTNLYRIGQDGIWRNLKGNVFQVDRKQNGSYSNHQTRIGVDGTYDKFALFNWHDPNVKGWQWTSEASKYNPYGFMLEAFDPIGIRATELYGYSNAHVTAVVANARYHEMGYDGFEDYGTGQSLFLGNVNHGHFNFTSSNGLLIVDDEKHTGKMSMQVNNGNEAVFTTSTISEAQVGDDQYLDANGYITPIQSRKYWLSCWVKPDNGSGKVSVEDQNGVVIVSTTTQQSDQPIEGWYRIELPVEIDAATTSIKVRLTGINTKVWFDDIRWQPYTSSMNSFVYDPATLWLIAQLDERNYATFYNYDEEGNLVQVKKETVRGLVTLQSSRQNTSRPHTDTNAGIE